MSSLKWLMPSRATKKTNDCVSLSLLACVFAELAHRAAKTVTCVATMLSVSYDRDLQLIERHFAIDLPRQEPCRDHLLTVLSQCSTHVSARYQFRDRSVTCHFWSVTIQFFFACANRQLMRLVLCAMGVTICLYVYYQVWQLCSHVSCASTVKICLERVY
jgi:hypothetical protein